jgi:hypothetical protein
LILKNKNYGLAHGAEFFIRDDAGIERVGLHARWEFVVCLTDQTETGDNESE